jgi:ribonuclease HI
VNAGNLYEWMMLFILKLDTLCNYLGKRTMNQMIIHTDGGARGNPGPAAIGVVIKAEDNTLIHTISRRIGQTTNNIAEYSAVVAALEWIKGCMLPVVSCNFFLDSTLVVNQLNGLFKVKDGHLRELVLKVRILEQEIGLPIYYTYVPREKNKEADVEVNKALDSPI